MAKAKEPELEVTPPPAPVQVLLDHRVIESTAALEALLDLIDSPAAARAYVNQFPKPETAAVEED